MIGINWYVLLDLDVIDSFEDCKTVSNTVNSHLLEVLILHLDKRVSSNIFLCKKILRQRSLLVPINIMETTYQQIELHTDSVPRLTPNRRIGEQSIPSSVQ